MTELQQKQLAFLEETVAFYNLDNRCVTGGGNCRYHLPGKEGCAIGRKIVDKNLCRLLDDWDGDTGVSEIEIFEQLPEELQLLGKRFLEEIQELHDDEDNWTLEGISDTGLESVKEIKHLFGLL
jgi:hypothetical protein